MSARMPLATAFVGSGIAAALACGSSSPSSPPSPGDASPGAQVAYVGMDAVRGAIINRPAGTQPGDLLISAALGGTEPRLPAGWTPIGIAARVGPDGFEHSFAAGWRIVEAADSSWSWTNGVLTMTHAYRHAASSPIQAFSLTRSLQPNPPLAELRASSAAGDAAVYMCIGVYHANVHPAAQYTGRIDWTADDYGSGDRLGLEANQTTGGRLDTAGDAWNDRGVLHLIVRAAASPRATRPAPLH